MRKTNLAIIILAAVGIACSVNPAAAQWNDRGHGWDHDDYRDRDRHHDRFRGEDEWVVCAHENGYCHFRGAREVYYGAGRRYVSRVFRDGVECNNRVFGDPVHGVVKQCMFRR